MFINKKANASFKVEVKPASAIIGIAFVQESKTDKFLRLKVRFAQPTSKGWIAPQS